MDAVLELSSFYLAEAIRNLGFFPYHTAEGHGNTYGSSLTKSEVMEVQLVMMMICKLMMIRKILEVLKFLNGAAVRIQKMGAVETLQKGVM